MDDHPIVRHGLRELINQEKNLEVCGDAEDVARAFQAIKEKKPDLVIVDISLKGRDGMELIKMIKAYDNRLPVLVLSIHEEELYAERALRAGARGYLMKQDGTEKVVTAVGELLQSGIYLSETMKSRLLGQVAGAAKQPKSKELEVRNLSDRELQVFKLLGQGRSTSQIAD